jgi:hypothetical protein
MGYPAQRRFRRSVNPSGFKGSSCQRSTGFVSAYPRKFLSALRAFVLLQRCVILVHGLQLWRADVSYQPRQRRRTLWPCVPANEIQERKLSISGAPTCFDDSPIDDKFVFALIRRKSHASMRRAGRFVRRSSACVADGRCLGARGSRKVVGGFEPPPQHFVRNVGSWNCRPNLISSMRTNRDGAIESQDHTHQES